ncbi:MAG: hypothetical protein KDC88_00055 [Ignavibacteriae bacterium]|nr:hypothetical protein [Ignavibacteriota bacterium]
MNEDKKNEKKKFKRSLLHKIINVLIGIVAFFLFFLIIFFGFSQTQTFRNFLKSEITELVSESLNGELHIDKIEGSILSSVILHETYLVSEKDTLVKAQQITLKTSPIHLLLKRILIREFVIKNAYVYLTEDENKIWSFSKLSKNEVKDSVAAETIDSTSSPFPFTIQVNDFRLENVNFLRQTYENNNSAKYHKHLTYDDLRLNGIFLNARLFANLSSSTVRLYLNNFSVNPNFQLFDLKKLSGEFELTENHAVVNNLNLVTENSNIRLSAQIDDLNLLGSVELQNFKEYPLKVNFEAFPLRFSDLYTFIDDIDFLNEEVNLMLRADGYFGDFDIRKLSMGFGNSVFNATGKILNLHTPEKLFLDVEFKDSKIVESEAHSIIKGLDIPLYKNLTLTNINGVFKGEPTRFHAELTSDVDKGNVYIDTYLDLQQEQMDYDISFNTTKLNLSPVIDIESSLTTTGKIVGVGTDPTKMNAELNITAFKSVIDSIEVDSLTFTSSINSKILDVNLNSIINQAYTSVEGNLDLLNSSEPIYDLTGKITNFDLSHFTKNLSDSSNLNFTFFAKGKNLNIDDMIGNYEVSLEPSYLRNLNLDTTSISLKLLVDENERKINLKSEFADFNIDGKFSLAKAIDILVYEGETITKIISNKIENLNPVEESIDSTLILEAQTEIPPIVKENLEFNYNFLFKDFDLIALFLKNDELDIVGSGEGFVKNDSLHFEISTDINIENLLNKRKNEIIYLSEVKANLNFSRDNRYESFNKIFGTISLEGDKVYFGTELNNIEADFVFNQSKLFFNTALKINNNLSAELEGIATTSLFNERIDLNNILINYKNIPWENYDTCSVVFTDDGVQLSDLVLVNSSAIIEVDGQINKDESHNFFIFIESMPGAVLSNYIFDDETQPLGGDINLNLVSSGFLDNPEINVDLNIYNVAYDKVNFGSLNCTASHKNFNTLFDIDFMNQTISTQSPLLTIDGSIPLKINYIGNDKFLEDDSQILISLRSNDFDIGTFGNVLPFIKNQSGKLNSKIDIQGPLNNLDSKGFFDLIESRFTLRENNLDYQFGLRTIFDNQNATIDSLSISNKGGSRYSGEIKGTGFVELKKFPFSSFNFVLNGDLALLGKNSQTRTSTVYGDLLVKSDKNWKFGFNDDVYFFDGNIIVERADLVYTNQSESRYGKNGNIIYKILEDSSKINLNTQKFVRILNETRANSIDLVEEEPIKFDFNTNIIINNIASFNFIIAPDYNQKLSVETTGQFELETIGNDIKTQGSLSLLNGSRLEFFKSFEAVGNIRFESDLADPHFDIVATYIGEIDNFEGTQRTEEVAVKLKLNTAYSKLKESLSSNKENLSVYTGRSDIENNTPDPKYGQSNALTFIILDQLTLDLNDQQKSTLADMTENAAFSLLGSQLTNYLNSSLGGLISNIKLNKYSSRDSYKLLFSGKYNNVRYSFGGSFGSQTDYLQLSKADIKLEYLFNPNFLIRVEQKDPIIETTTEEKVQEVGIKYKFEF